MLDLSPLRHLSSPTDEDGYSVGGESLDLAHHFLSPYVGISDLKHIEGCAWAAKHISSLSPWNLSFCKLDTVTARRVVGKQNTYMNHGRHCIFKTRLQYWKTMKSFESSVWDTIFKRL